MSTRDDDHDAERTADWPSQQIPAPSPTPPPVEDDGGATTAVPRMPPPPPGWQPPAPPPRQHWTGPSYPGPGMPPPGGPPPQPGWGPAPPYPPPVLPTPAPTGRRRWPLVVVATLAVAALVAGGIYLVGDTNDESSTAATSSTSSPAPTSTSATPTPTAPATIAPTSVATYLAPPDEVGTVIGAAPLTPGPLVKTPFSNVFVDPYRCTGSVLPGSTATYSGKGFTGFAAQNLWDSDEKSRIIQAVSTFGSERAATQFYDRQVDAWKQCTDTDFTADITGAPTDLGRAEQVAELDGIASQLIVPTGPMARRTCQHAITARRNVVIDVRVCTPEIGSAGVNLARKIAEKVDAAR